MLRRAFSFVCSALFGACALAAPQGPQKALDKGWTGSVDPEGARPLVRWGAFNGSYRELDKSPCALPSHLAPGAKAVLPLANLAADANAYLRVRVGFDNSGEAGLKVSVGGKTLWNEVFIGGDRGTATAGNWGPKFEFVPFQLNRIVFVPRDILFDAKEIVLENPGTAELAFDAVQLETRASGRRRSVGLDAFSGFKFSPDLTKEWGHTRMRVNTQLVKSSDVTNRFSDAFAYAERQIIPGVPVQAVLEGTPEWLAMSSERMEQARKAKRPKWVAPRPDEYAALVGEFVKAHKGEFAAYEIWNEADISHFYRGTSSEYATLFKKTCEAIRQVEPDVPVMPAGMANFRPDFIEAMKKYGVYDLSSCVVMHPYCGQSPCWDLPYGQIEGYLYSRGIALELYPHESGFTSSNFEWFKGPPDWTPERQAEALSIALARILASGSPRVTVFHAGGMNHPYGLIDGKGVPKPAYDVFSTYAKLNGKGAERLDVSLVRADGQSLRGVYAAASRFADGSSVIVVNAAESATSEPIPCVVRVPAGVASAVDCEFVLKGREIETIRIDK